MRQIKISKSLLTVLFFGIVLIVSNGISQAGQIKILIEPSPIVVAPGQSVKLRVRLVNLPTNARVKWSLDAVGVPDHQTGKLNQDFMPVYTAPENPPSKPVYVQILVLGAAEGIPLAGAKSRIKFISGSAGGGGQPSQNTGGLPGNPGGGAGQNSGSGRSSNGSNSGAQGQQPGTLGGSSSQPSGSGGILWNSPGGNTGNNPSPGPAQPAEANPSSKVQWN
jgi:hypothetical protein